MNAVPTRRQFLIGVCRALGGFALAGVALRVLKGGGSDPQFIQPPHRFGWQIDPQACTYCGLCEKACVRRPSAVKAVNDQKKCSNCVACYGHLRDLKTPSAQIASTDQLVCPLRAVSRTLLFGGINGAYRYDIDPALCTGCSKCARECNVHGSGSMFLIIRPDLCFECDECAIARVCPSKAVLKVPLYPASEIKGVCPS